jgi:hypothetical protein
MGYYLLDNPPRSPQFYRSRNSTPTYAIGVHTSEGPTGPGSARNLARFISRRSDPGSYACIVDSEETVVLVPPDYTTFSVAASGYNSRTWHICLAGRSADLSPDDANTQAMIARAGEAIRALWGFLGIDPAANAQWIGTDALNRPGLFCHGDVQPWDRSDAWSRHPDRAALDQLLVEAIVGQPTPPAPTPTQSIEADMFHLKNTDGRDEFFALSGDGMALRCVASSPTGLIGPWREIKGGIAGSNLLAEVAKDGRLCVTLAATGELWGSWQTAPSSNDYCDWFKVNDLRKFLGA